MLLNEKLSPSFPTPLSITVELHGFGKTIMAIGTSLADFSI
jgi:hypothetical protein